MLNNDNRRLAEELRDGYHNVFEGETYEVYEEGFNAAVKIIMDHLGYCDAIFDYDAFRKISGVDI